jgi:hypothetical protein
MRLAEKLDWKGLIFYFFLYFPKEWHEYNSPVSMAQTATRIHHIPLFKENRVCIVFCFSRVTTSVYTVSLV